LTPGEIGGAGRSKVVALWLVKVSSGVSRLKNEGANS
jgi:hypothetical protein